MDQISFSGTKISSAILAGILTFALSGCSSDSDSTTTPTPTPPPTSSSATIKGSVVVPEPTVTTTSIASALLNKPMTSGKLVAASAATTCPNVPQGYEPLANAKVQLLDAQGISVGNSVNTDNCGNFTLSNAPVSGVEVSINGGAQFNNITIPVSSLVDADNNGTIDPVSTFPKNATLKLSGLTNPASDSLVAVVTDSASLKAVLGIPASSFTVKEGANGVPVKSSIYSASLGKPAAVAMVLDASGSMGLTVGSGASTRYEIAAEAANLFVTRKDPKDEVAVVGFDGHVDQLDETYFNSNPFTFVDASGQAITPAIPKDPGFTTDSSVLSFLINFYNPKSELWNLSSTTATHVVAGYYPFGGVTALWDASKTGVDLVAPKQTRRFVVAMTDGQDNSSNIGVNDVIQSAKTSSVSVFTVGIGGAQDVNVTDLEKLAKDTAGAFSLVDDTNAATDLPSVFDSIRTSIQFQYQLGLARALAPQSLVTVEVNYAGLTGSSNFTAQ